MSLAESGLAPAPEEALFPASVVSRWFVALKPPLVPLAPVFPAAWFVVQALLQDLQECLQPLVQLAYSAPD